MGSLFSEDPQYRRIQYKKLSDNGREWQQEIAGIVAERLPADLGLSVDVVFQKVDDEKGYGIGTAIVIDPATKEQVGIPLIIKAWHLAPVDLYFKGGKIFPLNEANLAKTFYQGSLGVGVAPKQAPPDMGEDVFADLRNPPTTSKYSADSGFLALIRDTLEAAPLAGLKKTAMGEPALLAAFHVKGTLPILKKYADSKPAASAQDKINRERTMALFTIKKDGPDAYRLYSAPDEVYDPIILTTDRRGLRSFFDERRAELWDFATDPISDVDRYGSFTIEPPKSPYGAPLTGPEGKGFDTSGNYTGKLGERKNAWVFDPRQDDRSVGVISTFGRYGVKDADGVLAKGWVIPNVVDFNGKARPIKLFLGKALAAMQSRIAGIPLPDDGDTDLRADRADTGKLGTLVYREGDKVLATVPFQVTAVTVYHGIRALSIIDYQGNDATLIMSPTVDGIVKVTGKDSAAFGPLLGPKTNYIVSARMFFVRMPRLCQVSASAEEFKPLAVPYLDQAPMKVAMANGRYTFRSGRLAKYASAPRPVLAKTAGGVQKAAFDFAGLQRHEAEFLLRYWGLDHEKTAHVLDNAKDHLYLEVHHLHFPDLPGPVVKLASAARQRLVQSLRLPIEDAVKLASNLDDAQSVDAVLSLGFVNEENIDRFASAEPMLWEVSNLLSKLLLAARIGVEDIPEENVQGALQHIQRVIDGLTKLKMLKEHQEKTSSVDPRRLVGGRLLTSTTPVGVTR